MLIELKTIKTNPPTIDGLIQKIMNYLFSLNRPLFSVSSRDHSYKQGWPVAMLVAHNVPTKICKETHMIFF